MMNATTQIKESLISRIKDSDDIAFLSALQTIMDASNQALYELTPEQEAEIALGRTQIQNNEMAPHAAVMSATQQWLSKK
jgi:hypothetical protein